MKREVSLTVYFRKGVDNYIVAECPQIPGCMSQGKTLAEAKKNIKNAIHACLEVILEDALPRRPHINTHHFLQRELVTVKSFQLSGL